MRMRTPEAFPSADVICRLPALDLLKQLEASRDRVVFGGGITLG